MDYLLKYKYLVRNITVGVIFLNIIIKHRASLNHMSIYLGIFIIILINDYIRHNYLYYKIQYYKISILFSIILGGALVFLARGYTSIYMITLIFEIVIYLERKTRTVFLTLHILVFLAVTLLNDFSIQRILRRDFWLDNGIDLLVAACGIAAYIILIYVYEYQSEEKRKAEKLNKDLKESYIKLQEFSKQIEELTITKERNRVAQEIHDSLGHFLTALIMNLDYMEKVFDKNPEESMELIIKAQKLARDSMNELRDAVYTLKDSEKAVNLLDLINELINNLTINQEVDVKLDINGEIKGLSLNIKNIIFKTIQEALTNSIKHGQGTRFFISIQKQDEILTLTIKDNGRGCGQISKGHGLKGIEERVNNVKGIIKYQSARNKGFEINVSIPLKVMGVNNKYG